MGNIACVRGQNIASIYLDNMGEEHENQVYLILVSVRLILQGIMSIIQKA